MTLTELQDLSPDELRVMVAELRGDKCDRCNGTGSYMRHGEHQWFRMQCNGQCEGNQQPVPCDHVTLDSFIDSFKSHKWLYPNYPKSLDLCREFEDAMTGKEWDIYSKELEDITRKQGNEVFPKWREVNPCRSIDALLIYATPLQKCQAYILTKATRTEGAE